MSHNYQHYWQQFKEGYPRRLPKEYSLMQFGNTKEMADELGQLVLTGEKTATSSLIEYQREQGREVSQVGTCYLLIDWLGTVLGVLQVTKTATVAFGEIKTPFALAEGDGSFENWLEIHQAYYDAQLKSLGKSLTMETLLHCEWFRLISDY